MQVCHDVKNASPWNEFARNGGLQMLYVLQFMQLWRSGGMYVSTVIFKSFPHHRYDNRMFAVILLTL